MSSVKTSEGKRGPYHRYTFKTKETFVAKVVWRLGLTYDDHVLDAYTIASIGIITRLCLVMRFGVQRVVGDSHHLRQSCRASMAYYCMLWVGLRGSYLTI
jgi:hypothetical protein